MASFAKVKKAGVGRLFLHNNRQENDGVEHSNTDIDNSRTHLNYNLKKGKAKDVFNRISEVFNVKRSDQTVLGEMIVTLPKDVKAEDEKKFFQSVYKFYCKEFGEKNIINAVVHKDEKTPHIHLDFVPVIKGEHNYPSQKMNIELMKWRLKNGINNPQDTERLCCKDLINRQYLQKMHPRLSEYVRKDLGYEVEILNGATINGARNVAELKLNTLNKEVQKYENKKTALQREINELYNLANKWNIKVENISLLPLLRKIDNILEQNKVLKDIISREHYKYNKKDIELLKNVNSLKNIESTEVSVIYGELNEQEIPENAIVIIEMGNKLSRKSPQQDLLNRDEELYGLSLRAEFEINTVIGYKVKKREYIFFKTDDEQQTASNIILLENMLRSMDLENKILYIQQIRSDRYNSVYDMIKELNIPTEYFVNSQNSYNEEQTKVTNKEERKF